MILAPASRAGSSLALESHDLRRGLSSATRFARLHQPRAAFFSRVILSESRKQGSERFQPDP
jgi:hypothetical protein